MLKVRFGEIWRKNICTHHLHPCLPSGTSSGSGRRENIRFSMWMLFYQVRSFGWSHSLLRSKPRISHQFNAIQMSCFKKFSHSQFIQHIQHHCFSKINHSYDLPYSNRLGLALTAQDVDFQECIKSAFEFFRWRTIWFNRWSGAFGPVSPRTRRPVYTYTLSYTGQIWGLYKKWRTYLLTYEQTDRRPWMTFYMFWFPCWSILDKSMFSKR